MKFHSIRATSVAFAVAALLALVPAAGAAPSWTPPTVLGPTGREAGAPEVAVAPGGEAIATWVGRRPNAIRVSTRPPGQDWSPPVTIAAVRGEVDDPQLAVSAKKAVIVWTDSIRTRRGRVRAVLAATRLPGKGWGRPRNISAAKRRRFQPESREPQVAMASDGKAIVVWRATDERHSTASFIASATQAAARTAWTAPTGFRSSYEGEEPRVAVTPTGEAVAIWGALYNEESSISVSSRPAEGPWEAGQRLATPGTFPQPRLAFTSKGEAIGAWVVEPKEGRGTFVQVATRPTGGSWTVTTLKPKEYGTGPMIVTEPGGRAMVLWSTGSPAEGQTVLASRHDPGGAWSEPTSVAAEGLPLPAIAESAIEVTPEGESVAIWATASPSGGTTIRSSSRRGGQPWSEPTDISTSPGARLSGAPDLHLALAPGGQAFAVWRCFDGTRWVIQAASRSAAASGS